MNTMRKQIFDLFANYLGEKILSWVDAKPKNKELRKVLQATKEVLNYANYLETGMLIKDLRITQLQNKVKQLQEDNDELLKAKKLQNDF